MSDVQTVVRTEVDINGRSYFLAQSEDPADVKRRVQEAAPGTFVDFTVTGNRSVSVLISSGAQIVITTETVAFDPRDDQDAGAPYDGVLDAF